MTGPLVRLLPHQWGRRTEIVVDVHYAALIFGDYVELSGLQLADDGTPVGEVWLLADIRDLPGALVEP
ncbi:hypothetical protein [Micromonospora sp. NPDC049679]|uniref:hypothetical protein n=1 Tax=Micromonospora sp. NPDC049679 TaxID=3155920 RepID=UPI0033DC1E13